ncbi:MAG TPA: C25 family cysteine peptidase [Cytophagales bacterium]|nr:C25 family cysteine peptidase [Cytophagales bacterium]
MDFLNKRTFVFAFLFMVSLGVPAQDFGNEWIVTGQKYFKIKTAENGIYRITYQDLVTSGFPVNTPGFNKGKIQMFHRGVEQAIYISGAQTGTFNSNEVIEFYGKKNDGFLDAYLYKSPGVQPHQYYNLYTDTTAFFITYAFANVTGKRMETRTAEFNSSNLPKETYHLEENLTVFVDQYSEGQYYPLGSNGATLLASYDTGEGWTGARIQKTKSRDFKVSGITGLVASGAKPKLELVLVGRNNRKHNVNLTVGPAISSLRSIKDLEFDYYSSATINETIEFADISNAGDLNARVLVNGFPNESTDYVSVSYVKLTYPQSFSLTGGSKIFNIAPNPGGKSFVEISNITPATIIYDITDPNNVKRLNYFISGSTGNTVVSNTVSGRKLLVVNNEYKAAALSNIAFRNLSSTANYLIVTNKLLHEPVESVGDPIKAYTSYRASVAGGSYDTLSINVDQLYNQFTYGEVSPLAIRRFADYMLTIGNPKFLFLIGKALNVTLKYHRTAHPADYIHRDLVPTMGFPGSDVLFTAGLKGTGREPAIPTGRIAARTPQEVVNYLNKIKEMEALSYDDLWHKDLIHLSGGLQSNEVELFKSYTQGFADIAEDAYLGGDVTLISKTTNLTVEFINIAEQINKGALMVTFFGHSAPDVTDIEIGKCTNPVNGYNNKGKYPMFFVNGCDAGDIFSTGYSLGEDWMMAADKGAIAFLAYSHLAYAGPLKRFAEEFYSTVFGDSVFINKTIGEINKETVKRFTEKYSPIELYTSQATEMVLQGDPAYKLFPSDKPDYETNDNLLYLQSFDGKTITALTDSFSLGIIARNLGKISTDSLHLQIKRSLSSGDQIVLDTTFLPVFYEDTLFVNIQTGEEGSGLNRFEVILDPLNIAPETDETNNIGILEYFIPLNQVVAIAPKEFSIVNKEEVKLIAQNTEISSAAQQYLFEIDTSYLYNSGWKKQQTISSVTIPEWKVNISIPKDTVVFYWRVKLNNNDPDNAWATSSFTYIKNGAEGWAQSAFPQLLKDKTADVTLNTSLRKAEFNKVKTQVSIKTHGKDFGVDPYKSTQLLLNDFGHVFDGRCGNNRLLAVAFNKITAEPYLVLNKVDFPAAYYCGRTFGELANRLTDAQITGGSLLLEDYINRVPDGDFVILFSSGQINYETWPLSTKDKLQELGIDLTNFNQLKNGYPYIVFGQKGAATGTAVEVLPDLGPTGLPLTETLTFNYTVSGQMDRGSITSSFIGPSSEWNTLYTKSRSTNSNDFINYDVIGVSDIYGEQILASAITEESFDLSFIDEKLYPRIKIRANLKDSVDLTPPQLLRWQVNYTGFPEGVLYATPGQKLEGLELQEGEEMEVKYVFKNISDKDFTDSIAVQATFINNTTLEKTVNIDNYKPLLKNDSIPFSVQVTTFGKVGVNSLQTYVNPRLQPEENYFNNVITLNKYLNVDKDNANPILDVVFDGVHIMDGDIVSPSPLITITLKDENQYKIKKDTVGLEIFLKRECDGCLVEQIFFNNPNLKWYPGDETNKLRVEYQPPNLENGRYNLQVQGKDASGNRSGINPVEKSFEVINESTITNFYPYPNPFSTKTRFVFTLTGREIPDEIKILVMTISGKVVREINQDELGALKIGNNISDFHWDGTDQYGDKLANGVYLYKVTVKKNGQKLDQRKTGGDKGFQKGFGKMYILR